MTRSRCLRYRHCASDAFGTPGRNVRQNLNGPGVGHPATVSPRPVTGLLREEPGFDGLVVSDAVEMRAVRARYGLTGAVVRGRGPRPTRRHIG